MKVIENLLVTPILFIYPEFGQFDYVKDSSEDKTIWDIFSQVFEAGLPWDEKKHYVDQKNLRYFVMVEIF